MPSFDIVSEVNKVELKNVVEQVNKEVTGRFDFKGSDARVEQKDLELTLYADDEFKVAQVTDILNNKCAKRGVDVRLLDFKNKEKIGGDKMKQIINVKNGIESELAKKIVKLIKDKKATGKKAEKIAEALAREAPALLPVAAAADCCLLLPCCCLCCLLAGWLAAGSVPARDRPGHADYAAATTAAGPNRCGRRN